MDDQSIYVTEFDLTRLRALIDEALTLNRFGNEYLDNLDAELRRAVVVRPEQIPADVVTLHSRVRLRDMDTGEEEIFTLVFPSAADMRLGRISVLAPIGTAMLGYRVGQSFEWPVPAGVRRLEITEVLYQPEAAGDFHL